MIIEFYERIAKEAKVSRSQLTKKTVKFLGVTERPAPGDYLRNFAGCILNRQIDIFDDTTFLLEANRIQAACMVSRAMIETYAFSKHLYAKVDTALRPGISLEVVDGVLDDVLKYTNSSRHKVSEQEKLAKGIFSLDDYQFTAQARERMEMGLAASEHVMNALRELFRDEKHHLEAAESRFEMAYDALSEWVHPSQTSVFHHYTSETQVIPTSFGPVNLFDSARFSCSVAMQFITDAGNQYEWALALADAMDMVNEPWRKARFDGTP